MTKTEIKKALYKEKPTAKKVGSAIGYDLYVAELEDGYNVEFKIPVEDCIAFADKAPVFKLEEPAQLLIRWMV